MLRSIRSKLKLDYRSQVVGTATMTTIAKTAVWPGGTRGF